MNPILVTYYLLIFIYLLNILRMYFHFDMTVCQCKNNSDTLLFIQLITAQLAWQLVEKARSNILVLLKIRCKNILQKLIAA